MWAKVGIGSAVVAFGSAAVVMTGSYEQGAVYPLPEAEVYRRLVDMPLPPELDKVVQRAPGVDLDVTATPGQGVSFALRQNGTMIGRLDTKIVAEGPNATRVTTDVVLGDLRGMDWGERQEDIDYGWGQLKQIENEPLIKGVARIALQEQVSSALERRSYDKGKVEREVQVFVARNPQARTAMMRKFESMAREGEARWAERREQRRRTAAEDAERGTSRSDWVNRGARPGQPMVSSAPMADPSYGR